MRRLRRWSKISACSMTTLSRHTTLRSSQTDARFLEAPFYNQAHALARAVIRTCAVHRLLYHAVISVRRFLQTCNRI